MNRLWAVAAVVVIGGAAWAWPSGRAPRARRHPIHAAPSTAAVAAAMRADSTESADAPEAARGAGAPVDDRFTNRRVDVLIERLSSPDQSLVIDAADGLRARRATFAIPQLAAIDVVAKPDAARTVIESLGKLGGMATGADRAAATDRLLALLAQEKARDSADAAGNVLQIYEALGDTGDARAAAALERELADTRVPIAALDVVADALVKLAQASSKPALATAQSRVASLSLSDDLDKQVQREVVAKLEWAQSAF